MSRFLLMGWAFTAGWFYCKWGVFGSLREALRWTPKPMSQSQPQPTVMIEGFDALRAIHGTAEIRRNGKLVAVIQLSEYVQ